MCFDHVDPPDHVRSKDRHSPGQQQDHRTENLSKLQDSWKGTVQYIHQL